MEAPPPEPPSPRRKRASSSTRRNIAAKRTSANDGRIDTRNAESAKSHPLAAGVVTTGVASASTVVLTPAGGGGGTALSSAHAVPPSRAAGVDMAGGVSAASVESTRRPARRIGIAVVLFAFALCGGAIAAHALGYFHSTGRETSRPLVVAAVSPTDEAALPAAAPQAAATVLRDATVLLKAKLRSESARIQRLAASALARTGNVEAIEVLAAAIPTEPSDLAKLDIQYALARGGDARGVEGLVTALRERRRDVRLEAASRLALLGDKRAIEPLAQFLDVSQLRLGAAEQLAYLAEPRAIRVLRAVQADPKSSPDDKARAAIALGHAGNAEVAPIVREFLVDARFNAFAAAALARLADPASGAVRALLVSQLGVASLRVGAARSLRILEPDLDPVPLLGPLVASFASGTDAERVAAAEAVLLLTGPGAWSERE